MTQIVDIARSWLGTPYVHQASVKGAGTDCLGLIRGIWREFVGVEPEAVPAYSADWAEPQNIEVLADAARRLLVPLRNICPRQPGQILLFRMRDGAIAKHLGVLANAGPAGSFIHAYSGRGVVESSLSEPWARRVVARFDYPNSTTREGK